MNKGREKCNKFPCGTPSNYIYLLNNKTVSVTIKVARIKPVIDRSHNRGFCIGHALSKLYLSIVLSSNQLFNIVIK